MRGNLFAFSLVVAIMAVSAGAAAAGPAALPRLPWKTDPGALENLSGHLDMSIKDQAIVVALSARGEGALDRQFTIELGQASAGSLPSSFHSDAARIVFWTGHLVVIADREQRLFHFSVADFDPPDQSSGDALLELPAGAQKAQAAKYSSTRITGAQAIISNTPAGALSLNVPRGLVPGQYFLNDCCDGGDTGCCIDYQNYGSGGGGGCQSACSTTCNGSTCSASCASGRCAQCSCNVNPICYCY